MNKTWKRCVILFLIVFIVIFIGGVFSVNYLSDAVTNNNIHSVNTVIADKYYSDGHNADYYLVTTKDNKTLSIIDHGDGYGKHMWENIEVGKEYRLIVKEPELTDVNQFTHIIQYYNTTE